MSLPLPSLCLPDIQITVLFFVSFIYIFSFPFNSFSLSFSFVSFHGLYFLICSFLFSSFHFCSVPIGGLAGVRAKVIKSVLFWHKNPFQKGGFFRGSCFRAYAETASIRCFEAKPALRLAKGKGQHMSLQSKQQCGHMWESKKGFAGFRSFHFLDILSIIVLFSWNLPEQLGMSCEEFIYMMLRGDRSESNVWSCWDSFFEKSSAVFGRSNGVPSAETAISVWALTKSNFARQCHGVNQWH